MDDAGVIAEFQRPTAHAASPVGPAFRDAMARLAGGVGVVACWNGEAPAGLLVSSIAALSAEPPRVLFCVQKTARSHEALFRSRQCSLNILAEADVDEARRFSDSARTSERFEAGRWVLDPAVPPRCLTALSSVSGTISHRMDAGSHTVFVLNVREARSRDAEPLVYFNRAYAGLQPLG